MNPENVGVHEVLENATEILQNPTEILNIETSSIDAAVESLIQAAVRFGTKLLVAVLILVFGIWLSNKIVRSLKR